MARSASSKTTPDKTQILAALSLVQWYADRIAAHQEVSIGAACCLLRLLASTRSSTCQDAS